MISLRRGLATAVAAAYLTSAATFGLLAPAPALAVVKNVQIVNAGGQPVAGQTITIVFPAGVTNAAGESQVEEESDDRGFIYFDFPADGAYTLRFNGGEMIYEVTGASASRGISTTEVIIGSIAAVGLGALALSGDDDDDTAVVEAPQTPVADEAEDPMAQPPAEEEPAEEAPAEEDPMTEPPPEEPMEEDPMTEPPAEEPMAEDPMTEPPAEEPMEEDPMTEPPAEEPMAEDPMVPAMPEPEPEPEPEPDPVLEGTFEGTIGSATEESNPDFHPLTSLINAVILLEFLATDPSSPFNVEVHVSGAGGLDFRFQTMGTAQVSNGTVTVTTQPATAMGVFETFQTEGQLWELTITGDADASNTVMQVTGTGVIAVGTDGALPDSNSDGMGQPLEASIGFNAMMQ